MCAATDGDKGWKHAPPAGRFQSSECAEVSPGSVHVEAVDVEGEQGDHVGEQREGEGQAEAGGQASVPQDPLNEGRHQVDVAWTETS